MRGHCLCLPQDISGLAAVLPRLPKDLSILVVRRTNELNATFRDLRVRRHVVETALRWLKCNHPGYADVEISAANLAVLPVDDLIAPRTIDEDVGDAAVANAVSVEQAAHALDDRGLPSEHGEAPDDPSSVVESFLPVPFNRVQEADAVRKAAVDLARVLPAGHLSYPALGDEPVGEFDCNGLAGLCFPCLFPRGLGDPTDRIRMQKVEERDAMSWLLRFRDRRFARHSRFVFFMYNRLLRHQAMGQARFFVKTHPGEAHLTRAELKAKLQSNTAGVLLSRMSRYVANIKGSEAWWGRRKLEVDALFETKGPPTVFFTFRCVMACALRFVRV